MPTFLDKLNPTQREAATFGDGPLLILAGAGSGKTSVLTSRVAYLILEKGVDPKSILAVTFTNKAAGEMRRRLSALIGTRSSNLWLGTFHSIGLKILRGALDGTRSLTVYDDSDQLTLIRQIMTELKMPDKSFSPRGVLTRISQAKNEEIDPEEYAAHARDFFSERVARVYSEYQKRLRAMDAMDFGDLIVEPIRLLKKKTALLDQYRRRFAHVLVDEYQDTNKAQYSFTRLMASGTRNVFAVGDPDQSIYAWRGACIKNILDFEKDYDDATVIKLEQNYRSTKKILDAANSLIEKNSKRKKKQLWTDNPDGSPVMFEEADNEYHEARLMVKRLTEALKAAPNSGYRDAAVFYRTNAQSRVFEEQLIREGIPYAIVGGVRFYDRKEIKDIVAYLRVILNPSDAISFARAVNTPSRKIGKVTLDKVAALGASNCLNLFDALKEAQGRGLLNKTKAKVFIDAVDAFKEGSGTLALSELTLRLIEDSGYMMMLQDEATEEAYERVENLFEFVSAIKDFESAHPGASLSDFLDHVALISDIDSYEDSPDRLTLMTLHSAKGLEFNFIFITGMEEGLFPHSRSIDDRDELEEERRLCYVGMTRAKKRLYMFSSKQRSVWGETRYRLRSRFIDEIAPEFIDIVGEEARPAPVSNFKAPNEIYYTNEESQLNDYDFDADAGAPSPSNGSWRIGMRVMHPAFGVGVIKDRSGTGEDTKLTVRFQGTGTKKLIVKYAGRQPAP